MNRDLIGPYRARWLEAVSWLSGFLLLTTFASYVVVGPGAVLQALYRFNLGGENNVAVWWCGMLLALAAVLAFDGYADEARMPAERRGWLALAGALLLLSFDEVASLHEYLANRGLLYLVPLGAVGLALVGYSLVQLRSAGVRKRSFAMLLAAFGLFALVPLHEIVQHSFEWPNRAVYGLRAVLEEGTELLAMLLLLAVTSDGARARFARTGDAFAAVRLRAYWLVAGVVLVPVLTAATFVLPYPGGPANWLAAVLLLACALNVLRTEGLLRGRRRTPAVWLAAFYLAASAATNAVPLSWDAVVLGRTVGIRGLALALLLLAAAPLLARCGRPVRPLWLVLAALGAAVGALRPDSQLLWGALPPTAALWLYAIESRVQARAVPTADDRPEAAVTVPLPTPPA